MTMILCLYFIFAACLYHKTFRFVFRSDEWILYNPFIDFDFSLKSMWRVIAFEMFGDIRFFPLSHLLLFVQFKLFGTRTVLYKITAIAFHALNGFMVYAILTGFGLDHTLSVICGLLFLSLFTHFDTVTWTYHIYHVLFSTLLILISVYLMAFAVPWSNPDWAVWSVIICGTAMFLYEAIVPVLLFACMYGTAGVMMSPAINHGVGWIVGMWMVCFLFYLSYGVSYILFFRREKKVSGSVSDYMSIWDVFSLRKFRDGLTGLLHNIKIFLHNSGLPVKPRITDIVYLPFSLDFRETGWRRTAWKGYLLFVASALIHIRLSMDTFPVILFLEASAFAYIFLFIIGRNVKYAVTQPRYQYFFNALQVVVLALLMCRGVKGHGAAFYHLALVMTCVLVANSLNVLKSNTEIARILYTIHDACWTLKRYLSKHKSKRVYVDFSTTPKGENGKFFLGSDIVLDVLFHDNPNLTKDAARADMILDRDGLRDNPFGTACDGDFTLSFSFLLSGDFLTKAQKVYGSPSQGVAVYIDTDFHVCVKHGESSIRSEDALVEGKGWHDVIIEKDRGHLVIVKDGVVVQNTPWDCAEGFSSDQRSCLGDFYFGPRAPYYITDMHVCRGMGKYGLHDAHVGKTILSHTDHKENWWPNEWLSEIQEIKDCMARSDSPEKLIPVYYAESFYKLASFTEKEGNLERALSYFQVLKNMAGTPTLKHRLMRADLFRLLPGIYYHMGTIQTGQNDRLAAIESFITCLSLEPAHKAAANALFAILSQMPDGRENAVSTCLDAISDRARMHLAYVKIIAGLLDQHVGSNEDSCGKVRSFLGITPAMGLRNNGFNLLYKTASFFEENDNLELAEYIFERLVAKMNTTMLFDEKHAFESGCYFHLAQIKRENGSEAVTYLEKCLNINPNHMKARQNLSELTMGQPV